MAKFGFDGQRFYKDLVDYLIPVIDSIAESKYREAVNALHMEAAKSATSIDHAQVENTTYYEGAEKGTKFINAHLWFYALAIMDSFGTGTKMDIHSRYLSDYIGSDLWNRLRDNYEIVGRKKGSYTNIFGEQVESSGAFAGRLIPLQNNISPSHAIQNMEKWIITNRETEMERQVRDHVLYFIQNNAHKYFRSGGK